jgi:hypothetical protein
MHGQPLSKVPDRALFLRVGLICRCRYNQCCQIGPIAMSPLRALHSMREISGQTLQSSSCFLSLRCITSIVKSMQPKVQSLVVKFLLRHSAADRLNENRAVRASALARWSCAPQGVARTARLSALWPHRQRRTFPATPHGECRSSVAATTWISTMECKRDARLPYLD